MSKTKFTKGPWRFGTNNIANTIEAQSGSSKRDDWDDDYRVVATVQACIDDYNHAAREENVTANLHLVAAAPDLYEALKAIMDDVEPTEFALSSHIRDAARSALAKARGEAT